MKLFLIAALLLIAAYANAQSPFRAEPKLAPREPTNAFARAVNPLTDSIVNAYRFGVGVSPAGFTLAGVYQASAALEYGLQHQDYNYATKTYTVLWSANVVWIPINTAAKIQSIKDISSFGALFGIKNNLIQLGPFINPNAPGTFKNKAGIWAVVGINLN
jgi:hypothetical protein